MKMTWNINNNKNIQRDVFHLNFQIKRPTPLLPFVLIFPLVLMSLYLPLSLYPLFCFVFFIPNSCCRYTQLQQASANHTLQLSASLGSTTRPPQKVFRIKYTCLDPKHTHTHMHTQVCVRCFQRRQ